MPSNQKPPLPLLDPARLASIEFTDPMLKGLAAEVVQGGHGISFLLGVVEGRLRRIRLALDAGDQRGAIMALAPPTAH